MKTAIDSFTRVGMPAFVISEHGRVIRWNQAAADLFRTTEDDAVGHEWHSVITTVNSLDCCALCQTRRTVRGGGLMMPVDVILSIDGFHIGVTMMPVPLGESGAEVIGFLVLSRMETEGAVRTPISIQSRIRHLNDDRMVDELTAREREVLAYVVEGYDARSIAAETGITHATARNYVQRILSKLGARNKAEAVNVALSYNLLAS